MMICWQIVEQLVIVPVVVGTVAGAFVVPTDALLQPATEENGIKTIIENVPLTSTKMSILINTRFRYELSTNQKRSFELLNSTHSTWSIEYKIPCVVIEKETIKKRCIKKMTHVKSSR